jgi:outer membrane lipopolysaccharide assembly protein LptE/RlpB
MKRILRGLVLTSLVFLLGACGFHLKGMGGNRPPLPLAACMWMMAAASWVACCAKPWPIMTS